MNVGFYAPLKAPDHPIPSGDREMARSLIKALRGLGHNVDILCTLRTYDRQGDPYRQRRLQNISMESVRLILRRRPQIDLMFTYHPYYKAPDWIGPSVSKKLGIPYVVAETSVANKRAGGPWSLGHDATVDAVRSADHVFALTTVDRECIEVCRGKKPGLSLLPPFISMPSSPSVAAGSRSKPRLMTVAMMRSDIKLASYKLLAAGLRQIRDQDWELVVAGDGPGGDAVRTEFADLGPRVSFLGRLSKEQLAELYPTGDIFVWPGLREAYGLVFLEAQSHGLPVVAVRNGGVRDVVNDGHSGILCEKSSAAHIAAAIHELLNNVERRKAMGVNAIRHVEHNHSFPVASRRLDRVLRELVPS